MRLQYLDIITNLENGMKEVIKFLTKNIRQKKLKAKKKWV